MLRRLATVIVVLGSVAVAPSLAAPPPVAADAYVLADLRRGETLAARAPDRRLPMASTTKIMTALVVRERAALDERVTVPPQAIVAGTSADLVAGETLSVRDLLTGLMVGSGNDAAIALAVHVAGSQAAFADLMNARAAELGLQDTRFANPHGLDAPGHYSSVRDLVRTGQVAMRDPLLRRLVGTRTATIPGPGGAGRRTLVSKNLLLDLDPTADGIKTGFTDGAGQALVARATRPPVGSLYYAEIGAPTEARRASDGARILDWGFARYAVGDVAGPDAPLGRIPVRDRPGTSVAVAPATPVPAALLPGQPLVETLVAPSELRAPVRRGQVVGSIELRQGGVLIARRELAAAEDVDSPSLLDRVRAGIARVIP